MHIACTHHIVLLHLKIVKLFISLHFGVLLLVFPWVYLSFVLLWTFSHFVVFCALGFHAVSHICALPAITSTHRSGFIVLWRIIWGPLVEPSLIKCTCSCRNCVLFGVELSIKYYQESSVGDQVGKILYNFESATVQSWVLADEDHLAGLSFKVFMMEFKLKFLACSWEDKLIQDQITFQSMTPFLTWVNKVHNMNDELHTANSTYYIALTTLRKCLIPHLSPALKHLYI